MARRGHPTDVWLTALLDPVAARWTPEPETPSLVHALALLVDARFLDYQRAQAEAGWPPFGAIPTGDISTEERFVAAVGLQLIGSPSALEQFDLVLADPNASQDLRTAATVLASVALRDAGRPDLALHRWDDVPAYGAHRSIALLHRAICQRELGLLSDALEATLDAEATADQIAEDTDLAGGIRAVATRNVAGLAFELRRFDLVEARREPTLAPLLFKFEARRADALEALIPQEFEGRLADPGERTLSFRQEDPVQTPLIACLLRAELLADWSLLASSRKLLGTYQLAAAAGADERDPTAALHLLRRAGDAKSLRRTLKWYRSEGPLQPVREYGAAVARTPWLPTTVAADLVSLGESADAMRHEDVDISVRRLLGVLDGAVSAPPGTRPEAEVNAALAALLSMASPALHALAAERFGAVLWRSDDELFLQAAPHVIQSLRWETLTAEQLGAWNRYCIAHLRARDSHQLVAAALLRSLPATPELQLAARTAFHEQPNILTSANLLALGRMSRSTAVQVARVARDELHRVRADAHEGRHGFGGYVETGTLLARLLIDYPSTPGWRDLVAFILDPRVSPSKRSGPLRHVLGHAADVPDHVHRSLARWAAGTVDFVTLPFEDADEFRALVLRVRARYRVRSEDELLSDLLKLTTAPSRAVRFVASRDLPELAADLGAEPVLALAMALSRDAASEVRGAACASLPWLATSHPVLGRVAWDRVSEALMEAGARVPSWVLAGLAETDGSAWPPEVRETVARLPVGHLSATVRRLAAELLGRQALSPRGLPLPSNRGRRRRAAARVSS